jgi:phenylpropionate dioxygenase-like ring-hydroxylating dioxygenase large terminal subunit
MLECCYHGWRFDDEGTCRLVPGLSGDAATADRNARRAPAYPTVEQDGFVWVDPAPRGAIANNADAGLPRRLPHADDPAYTTVRRHVRFHAGLHACLENALDVPHTAFLHGGLFRGGREPVDIEVVVRHTADGVEADYIGEPRPAGVVGRLLAPQGGVVTHVDRFLLPSIAQIEYRLGDNHLVDTAMFTPISDDETDLHAAITFHLTVPHAVVRPLVTPVVNRILRQDASVLRRQSASIRRFGGEHFASTDLDVLGNHIRRLLDHAEPRDSTERRVTIRV